MFSKYHNRASSLISLDNISTFQSRKHHGNHHINTLTQASCDLDYKGFSTSSHVHLDPSSPNTHVDLEHQQHPCHGLALTLKFK